MILNRKAKPMKNLIAALAIGLAALTAADHADASPLRNAVDAPTIEIPFATVDYIEAFGFGDLSMFFAEGLASGTPQAGDLFVSLTLGFDPVVPAGSALGGLFSEDDDGAFLDGDVLATGFQDDVLQVLFGNLSGSAAADFGDLALMELVFIDPFPGANPLANLVDGTSYAVFATVYAATPIPVPAALPMLAAGLGGLVLLRRRG